MQRGAKCHGLAYFYTKCLNNDFEKKRKEKDHEVKPPFFCKKKMQRGAKC